MTCSRCGSSEPNPYCYVCCEPTYESEQQDGMLDAKEERIRAELDQEQSHE